MPWAVRKGAGGCGKNQWAVVNAQTGAKRGCHATVTKARKQLAALNVNVTEEGTMPDTLERLAFHESRPLAEAAAPAEGTGRLLVQLITPGWGSTGYYTPEVLQEAASEQLFAAGTHMYLDHPTFTESVERPTRSVRDLAGVLVEDAVWDGQALVAQARVFDTYRHTIAELADTIGVSVRGSAEVSEGEAEGRRGRIVERIDEVASVDFVTKAGRGGRIIEVLESAAPARVKTAEAEMAEARNIGQWLESRVHRDFTIVADDMAGEGRLTREERIALSGAIGDALAAFVSRVEADASQLYERDIWAEATASADAAEAEMTAKSINDLPDSAFAYIEPGGKKDSDGKTTPRSKRHFPIHDAAHVRNALARAPQSPFGDKALPKIRAAAKKLGVGASNDQESAVPPETPPAPPADETTPPEPIPDEIPPDETTPSADGTATNDEPAGAPDDTAPSAKETAMPDTPGAGAIAPTNPRQVMEAELAQLRRTAAIHAARNRARDVVVEALADAWLPPLAIARITADLLEDDRLPLVNDQLDEAALRDRTVKARDAAEAEHAESLQAQGFGRPRGLGSPAQTGGDQINLEERLKGSFAELGMTESAAGLAAKGR